MAKPQRDSKRKRERAIVTVHSDQKLKAYERDFHEVIFCLSLCYKDANIESVVNKPLRNMRNVEYTNKFNGSLK